MGKASLATGAEAALQTLEEPQASPEDKAAPMALATLKAIGEDLRNARGISRDLDARDTSGTIDHRPALRMQVTA
jgi:hypothetical protein